MIETNPTKYIIHACPQRMWYVEDYLIPSMIEQGIAATDIKVGCDTEHKGNLANCMNIFSHITQVGGTWHLQDDVIIARQFKFFTEAIAQENSHDIVCAFVIRKDDNFKNVGSVTPEQMWWSFPCIYIPNHLARECVNWFEDVARYKSTYSWMIPQKKFDDYMFKEFLRDRYPNQRVINMNRCLVDHIDFLIGGTTINQDRKNKDVRAVWFEDIDLVDELKERLIADGKLKDIEPDA